MKHYMKPIIGSVAIVAAFAFGALIASPVDALQTAHQNEQEALEVYMNASKALAEARAAKCQLIVTHGGECDDSAFGKTLQDELSAFLQR